MDKDFCAQNMTLVKINNIGYLMYNHVLRTMSIFKVLTDCETNMMPEIEWDISAKNVNVVFHAINNNYDKISAINYLSEHVEIIKFMKYLGVSNDIMHEYIELAIDDGSIIDYIDRCKNIPYDDTMIYIFDNCFMWYLVKGQDNLIEEWKKFIDKIVIPHFPINFQITVMTGMILKIIAIERYGEIINPGMVIAIISTSCGMFDCQASTDLIMEEMNRYMIKIEQEDNNFKNIFGVFANLITLIIILRKKNDK